MYGCEFVVRLSLAVEYGGVCNFSWFLYHMSSYLCCSKVMKVRKLMDQNAVLNTDDSPVSPTTKIRGPDLGVEEYQPNYQQTAFTYFKYLWSTCVTLGAVIIILYGISKGESVLPVPVGATYFILFATLTMLYFLEGLMIGMFVVIPYALDVFYICVCYSNCWYSILGQRDLENCVSQHL